MSSNSDNPLIRFVAFWWALGVFSLFAVILIAVKLLGGGGDPDVNDLEVAAASKRYDVAAKVKAAQEANLTYKEVEAGKVVQVPPHDVFGIVGKELVSAKPAPVAAPTQIVPGGSKDVKGPEIDYTAVDKLTPPAGTAPDPAVMKKGEELFKGMATCFACHGMDGKGVPAVGPPLEGSEWVKGPVSNLIRIQFRGLEGPITVHGQPMTFAAPMAAVMGNLGALADDAAVAAVLTYVRNSFGNSAPPVLPEQVKMLRGEIANKTPLKEADLIKPTP